MFHGQRINLYFVIIKIYKLYGIFHFVCNTPPILLAREKIPAPLPTRGRQTPPPPPGRCGFLLPYRFPTLFPFRNPPYPKSLLETAKGGFQGRAIRSPWRSTPYTLCIPGSGPRPFHPPLPPRNFSGVWGRSRPQPGSRGAAAPGRGGANFHKRFGAPLFYRTLHKPLLLRHEKGPANAGPFRLSKKWLAPLFRGFHSSLAPTARPGSYARKPLLRKAFCGFNAHPPGGLLLSLRDNSPCVAKSDQSLRGLRPPNPRGFFDKLGAARRAAPLAAKRRRPPHVRPFLPAPPSNRRMAGGGALAKGRGETLGHAGGRRRFGGPGGPQNQSMGGGQRSPPMLCARCARPPPPRAAGIFHRPNDPSANLSHLNFLQTKRAGRSR